MLNIENFFTIIILQIIFGIVIAVVFFILSIKGWKKIANLSLKCPKCNFIFKPPIFRRKIISFIFLRGFSWLFKIPTIATCPNCKRESLCKTIEDKDIEKETLPVKELPAVKGYTPSLSFKIILAILVLISVIILWVQVFLNR